ncbi:hypothetical protein AFK69_13615 [Xenorhabdus sp. GDc328]|nr:hypothetical protein AFK69_13615 [Xenorhabdus sp. GDc328]
MVEIIVMLLIQIIRDGVQRITDGVVVNGVVVPDQMAAEAAIAVTPVDIVVDKRPIHQDTL